MGARTGRGRGTAVVAAALAALLGLLGLTVTVGQSASAAQQHLGVPRVGPAVAAAAPAGAADWTVMIYDVADTNAIANDMISNLAYFAELPEMPNVNIVALVDLPEKNSPDYPQATLPGIAPFTTAKLMVLKDNKWNEVRDYGEVAMGRPDVLATFIEESAGTFPADKYGLVISDHGGAYLGAGFDDGPPGPSHLGIQAMREGMIVGMQKAGIDRFDLLEHDSCLMASYEVTSATAPLAKTIVASEESIFSDKTLDPQTMQLFGQNATAEEWGIANSDAYGKLADQYRGAGDFTAFSVLDGDRVKALDSALEAFTDAAIARMDDLAPQIARARNKALGFVAGLNNGDDMGYDLVDLGDFLRQLGSDLPDDVRVARDAVFAALDQAVTYQVTGKATEQAEGLNIYFPRNAADGQPYADADVAPPAWDRFLEAYIAAAPNNGSGSGSGGGDNGETGGGAGDGVAGFTSDQAQVVQIGPDGILIAGQLGSGDADDVAFAETQVYAELGGVNALVVALPAYVNAGGEGQVQGVWNYSVTALKSGNQRAPVSAVYQAQSGGLVGTFYAQYTAPGGEPTDVVFRVLLDSSGQIDSVTVSDANDQGGSRGITLENGGTLTPYLYVDAGSEFNIQLSSQSVTVGSDLEVGYPQYKPGVTFDMGVVVGDLAGNVSGAFTTQKVQ